MHAHISLKRHHNPNKKGLLCPKSKASGPRWRGRSAWMRGSFAIGHRGSFGGSRLTATSHQPPATSHQPFSRPASHTSNNTTPHPLKATPKSQQERPAMPEEQSVHARDGVADPHGCGNPLRSGIVGLSAAPNSQPPATSHQPPATSNQQPASSPKLPAPSPSHKKKRQAGFPLTCRFCNELQLTPDKLLFVFSRVVFVFCIRFRRNLFIVVLCFRRDIFLAFRHATVD